MKKAYKIVSKNKLIHYFALFFIAFSVVLSVASYNILGLLINSLLALDPNILDNAVAFNGTAFAIFLSLFILFELLSIIAKYLSRKLIYQNVYLILNTLRNDYSSNLLKLSYKQFNKNKKGYYYAFYVNNIQLIQNNGIIKIYEFFEDAFWAISALISLAFLFWPLVLIFIGLYLLLTFSNLAFNNFFIKIGEKLAKANNIFTGVLNKLFDAYINFYSLNRKKYYFSLQKENSDLLFEKEKDYIKNQFKPVSFLIMLNFLSQIIFLIASTLFIFYDFNALGSNLTIGSFITVTSLGAQALGHTINILFSISSVISVKEVLRNYDLKSSKKIKKVFLNKINSFKLENISFEYKDKKLTKKIFNNFSLLIDKNKKYALIGESGMGKSTLIRLLLGMEKPTKGKILINDKNLHQINLEDIYKNISYVDKDIEFFKDTIKNNILLDKKMSENEFNKILDIVDINFKDRIDNILDENNKLSEGQKQKIALARAIAQEKNIYFFDEAFANIDVKSTLKIKRNLFSLKNITIFEISHQIGKEMEQMYDKIIKI